MHELKNGFHSHHGDFVTELVAVLKSACVFSSILNALTFCDVFEENKIFGVLYDLQ